VIPAAGRRTGSTHGAAPREEGPVAARRWHGHSSTAEAPSAQRHEHRREAARPAGMGIGERHCPQWTMMTENRASRRRLTAWTKGAMVAWTKRQGAGSLYCCAQEGAKRGDNLHMGVAE
jgi:hypothetical protein